MWLGVAPRTYTKKNCVVKRDWIVCSEYDNYSKGLFTPWTMKSQGPVKSEVDC